MNSVKSIIGKNILFVALLWLSVAQASASSGYVYTSSGLYAEYNALQSDKYVTVSKEILKDGQCRTPYSYEGGIVKNFVLLNSDKNSIKTLAGTGGYLQTNRDISVVSLVSADLMNYIRGNVPSKLSGIKIMNGDRAFEYAGKVYDKYKDIVRADVRKAKLDTRHQFCKGKKDLYIWGPQYSVLLKKKYYDTLTPIFTNNTWDSWGKDGSNKKIFAYTIYMLLMESIQDEPGEYSYMTRSY